MPSAGRTFQIAGLTVLPFALLVGMTAEHGMVGELVLLAAGAGIFTIGYLLERRSPR